MGVGRDGHPRGHSPLRRTGNVQSMPRSYLDDSRALWKGRKKAWHGSLAHVDCRRRLDDVLKPTLTHRRDPSLLLMPAVPDS